MENWAGKATPPNHQGPRNSRALASDTPDQIIMKMQYILCHQIPAIPMAKIGMIGPLLIEGHNAPRRIASPEYKARVKAGNTAKTPKEYVMESIMHPNAFIAPAFVRANNPEASPMLQDFATKFTFAALEKLADFLLTLDCDAAMKDGLKGPPQEPIEKVCGPATKAAETSSPVKTAQLPALFEFEWDDRNKSVGTPEDLTKGEQIKETPLFLFFTSIFSYAIISFSSEKLDRHDDRRKSKERETASDGNAKSGF